MEEIREIFKGEAAEILQNLEPDIVKLEEGSDPETVNRVFRYFHTLKGSSGMAGMKEISQFTHRLENLMDGVRSKKLEVDGRLIDILLGSLDWIRSAIFGSDNSEDLNKTETELLARIENFTGGCREEEAKKSKSEQESPGISKDIEDSYTFYRITAGFRDSIFESGINPLSIMENATMLGRVTELKIDDSRLPVFDDLDPEKCYLSWEMTLRTIEPIEKIENLFRLVKEDNDIKIEDITKNYSEPSAFEVKRIGEILLNGHILTEKELNDALESQKKNNKKIAEIIVGKGYASLSDVQFALDEQEKIKKKVEGTTVRIATGKLDTIMNLLGEIVISQSAITRVADEIGGEEGKRVKNAVYGLDRITREFQGQIMAMRMIPIGPTFERFKRFVRDSAKEYGKEINLIIEGAETELDKTVIEKIGDPLKHMIRNSIDHGIEKVEERINAGKEPKGTIHLKAYHQEGSVYIEIRDDGRGIDREKVKKKALEMNLVKPTEDISDDKLFSFLFLPGFSTAEKVGALSGRGVGMDVVKTNIESLRGTIDVETKEGIGSTFRIKLPLTLAIIDGMLVRVGRWTYIIPLLSIIESIRPDKSSVKTIEGHGEVVYIRGNYVTLLRINELFKIESQHRNPWDCLVVIVESNGVYIGLMVDELIGQQQIVLKSMEKDLTKDRAISGASILGDGTVSLILDIHGLVAEVASYNN